MDTVPASGRICGQCGFVAQSGEELCPKDGVPLIRNNPAPGMVGKIIWDRYEVTALLGAGGMGAVYKAEQLLLGKTVALKVLHMQAYSDPERILRFQQEAKVISRLEHPNIVQARDFSVDNDGQALFVMEYLRGQSLSQAITNSGKTGLEPARAVRIFVQLCDAMQYAHTMGVIHRDIKPSNVMLTQDSSGREVAKILDFGIAKIMDTDSEETTPRITKTGCIFGSPSYMSPEQCLGQAPDSRSDIYALGCLMYETLTGQPPIEGANGLEVLHRQISESALPFSATLGEGKHVAQSIESVVVKALSKDPDHRYQTMSEVSADLLTAQQDEKFNANPVPPPSARHPRVVLGQVNQQFSGMLPAKVPLGLAAGAAAVAAVGGALVILGGSFSVSHLMPTQSSKPSAPAVQEINNPLGQADKLSEQATILLKERKFEEAQPLLEHAVSMRAEAGSKDYRYIGDALKLAHIYRRTPTGDQLQRAESMNTETIALLRAQPKLDSHTLANTLDELGLTNAKLGKLPEAAKNIEDAIAVRKQSGEPKTGHDLSALGYIYNLLERHAEAGRAYSQAADFYAARHHLPTAVHYEKCAAGAFYTSKEWKLAAETSQQGLQYAGIKQFDDDRHDLELLDIVYDKLTDEIGYLLDFNAKSCHKLGEKVQALTSAQQAVAFWQDHPTHTVKLTEANAFLSKLQASTAEP